MVIHEVPDLDTPLGLGAPQLILGVSGSEWFGLPRLVFFCDMGGETSQHEKGLDLMAQNFMKVKHDITDCKLHTIYVFHIA